MPLLYSSDFHFKELCFCFIYRVRFFLLLLVVESYVTCLWLILFHGMVPALCLKKCAIIVAMQFFDAYLQTVD